MDTEPSEGLAAQMAASQIDAVTNPPSLPARLWSCVPAIGRAVYSVLGRERTPDGFALTRPPRDSNDLLYSPDRRRRYVTPGQQAAMGWAVLFPLVMIPTLVLGSRALTGGKTRHLDMSNPADLLIALAFPIVVFGTFFCVWKLISISLEINAQIYDAEEAPEEFNPLDELTVKTRTVLDNLRI